MEGLYTIELLGKKRDVYFGMPAIEYVHDNVNGDEMERLGKGEFLVKDIGVITHLVYAAILGGCYLNGKRMDVQYRDVYVAIEKMMLEGVSTAVFEAVGKAFFESNSLKYGTKNKPGKASKKKPLTGGS